MKYYGNEKLFYKHLYKLFFRKKIKFCGVSNHTTSYYQKYSREKIYTIYNGLSSTNIQNIKYQYSIGFIGVMDSHKGWKYLYDAYNYLTDDLKDKVTFKFYGNILKEDCNNFKNDNNHLLYSGYSTDINLELRKLDAIVLPSISEGLPMSLLEAMRLSKPILATKVGGIPEMLYDGINGFIIERNPQNIATKIEKLYSNIDDYKKMAKNSYYIFNGKFQIEKIAKEYYNLYLMENKKGD